ncbi:MAG: hypothetical protein M5U34_28310 [Chloroflexi bacterium]|nr:hypothetical protein [Chloroflexota bacterium]
MRKKETSSLDSSKTGLTHWPDNTPQYPDAPPAKTAVTKQIQDGAAKGATGSIPADHASRSPQQIHQHRLGLIIPMMPPPKYKASHRRRQPSAKKRIAPYVLFFFRLSPVSCAS